MSATLSEALQNITLRQNKQGPASLPSLHSTRFWDHKIYIYISIFLYWGEGVEKKAAPILGPIQWQLLAP